MPEQGSLQCVVVTPERAVLDQPADFVALPMYDGELGVLPGRAPLIGRLGYGELRIRRGDNQQLFFVDGGFTQVRGDVVTVLTSRAQRGQDIDMQAANRALEAPPSPAVDFEARQAQLKSQDRARAQLRVARHARGESL
jgi:F-type H+-transporting ATPase subunit epsilon